MKKLILLLAVAIFAVSCNDKGPGSVKLKTEEDKTFYAMGFMLGSNLQKLELSDQELGALNKGLVDAAKGNKEAVELQIYQPKIQTMFKERMDKVAANEEKKGSKLTSLQRMRTFKLLLRQLLIILLVVVQRMLML